MRSRMRAPRKATWERIYATVRKIPHGRVATYGQVARLTGQCTARMVGYAMAGLEGDTDVPWHRVINAKGEISPRAGLGAEHQRQRLLEEGVRFNEQGRIDFGRYGLFPVSRSDAARQL